MSMSALEVTRTNNQRSQTTPRPFLIDIIVPRQPAPPPNIKPADVTDALMKVYYVTMCAHEVCSSLEVKSTGFPRLLNDFRALMRSLPDIGIDALRLQQNEAALLQKLLAGQRTA